MTSNSELRERRASAVPRGIASMMGVFADRAENAEIWDVDGRRYVDFAGGIAVLNTGHRHPKVMAAVAEQEKRFTHTAFQVMAYDSYIELAERLNGLVPIPNAKTLFMNSGAEAVENAVKIARAYTGRSAIIAFNGAFHGRSLLTMGLTGKILPYKAKFGPFPGDIYHAPFPIEHHGISEEQSLSALAWLFKTDVEPSRVAAIIIEPCDEVQTGFARTGKYFAIEHYGIEPDMITMAKSLAGGFPLSAISGRSEIMDAPDPGGLGSTYGGSPLGCAAGLAVIDVIEEEQLCERSLALGERIKARITQWKSRNDTLPIGDVRGLGAMVAFELVRERGSHEPDHQTTAALIKKAEENGLVLLSCGVFGNTVRILVPLTASDEIVDEGLDIIERSMTELTGAG
jgi:4-aminobutyrate aminotransferase-like enzyme